MLVYLLMIASIALVIFFLVSGSKLSDSKQALMSLQMNTRQLYSTEPDYSTLSNNIALKNGLIPQQLRKSSGLRNAWGGAVTLRPNSSDSTKFDISFEEVPQDACAKFAKHQAGAWVAVTVNGTDVSSSSGMIAAITNAVKETNTVTFVSD